MHIVRADFPTEKNEFSVSMKNSNTASPLPVRDLFQNHLTYLPGKLIMWCIRTCISFYINGNILKYPHKINKRRHL